MKLNNLNLNWLLHFHAIAKNRSLSLAAQDLSLSAPAITHSLNNLETSLKQKLCVRSRSGFQLTATGSRLFLATQKIVNELESYSKSEADEGEFSGIFSIGVLDNFDNKKVDDLFYKLSLKFPKMKFSIQCYDSDTINKLLLKREIDFGFGTFTNRSPRLKYTKIGDEILRYYISINHPLWKRKSITKDDLVGQKTTWLDNHNRTKSNLELNIFAENLKYKMQFFGFSNNLSAAVRILLSGHTIVPLPEEYGDALCKTHPVRKLGIDTKTKILDVVMAHNPSQINNSVTNEVMKYISLI